MSLELIDYKALAESRYTGIIESQAPLVALIETATEYNMKIQQELIDFHDNLFDVDNSKDFALDLIGKIVGQERKLLNFVSKPYFGFDGTPNAEPFDVGIWYSINNPDPSGFKKLDDDQYRRLIKARIIKNNSNCNRDDLIEVFNLLTGNNDCVVTEPSDGVVSVSIGSDPDMFAAYYFSKLYTKENIFPVPIGCRLNTNYI